jgi:hypothetical protein
VGRDSAAWRGAHRRHGQVTLARTVRAPAMLRDTEAALRRMTSSGIGEQAAVTTLATLTCDTSRQGFDS